MVESCLIPIPGELFRITHFPFPPDRPLPGTSSPAVPYVFVGDEAFPLSKI